MTLHPELQQIVREETDNGREVVQFMKKAMNGLFPKFTPQHQLMAGRVLAILCIEQGIEFVESVKKPSVPRTRDSAQRKVIGDEIDAALSAAEKEIAGYVKKLTGGGRRMIRFLIEAMDGGIKSFSPSLRIAAGKELIGYAYPIFVPARARDAKPRTASSSEQSPASPAQPAPAPVGVSAGQALLMYEDKYCQNDLNINASIVRRTLEKSNDPEAQHAEARRLWKEKEDFLKAQNPTLHGSTRFWTVRAPTFRPLLPRTRTTGGTTRTGSYARRACAPKTIFHVPAPPSPGTRKTPDRK